MCKSHFKEHKRQTTPLPPKPALEVALEPPPPVGLSVYDTVIPASVAWSAADNETGVMPLVQHLKEGFETNKPPAWHRNEERSARGLWPVHNPATQLESWERELVWTEILLLTGNPESSFRHLARAWGRDKGFHMVLAQFICERHGNVERKKKQKKGNQRHMMMMMQQQNSHSQRMLDMDEVPAEDVVASDVYDEAMYGDVAYNEALAADLFTFAEPAPGRGENERMFSFEDMAIQQQQQQQHHPHQRSMSLEDAVVSYDGHEEDEDEEGKAIDDDDYELAVIDAEAV